MDASRSGDHPPEEPPKPERGRTAAERGRDVSDAQAEVDKKRSRSARARAMMGPRFYFSMASGYPLVVKWVLWLCLALVYACG